jgi:hypothetical protein
MRATARYLWLTVKHKAFVAYAGLRWAGASPWLLLIHDWSKFTLSEAPHYGRQFFGDKGDPEGFAAAWLHHQNHNPHHWEYWIPRTGHNRGPSGDNAPLPMPERYVREMVADWLGASRAYAGSYPPSLQEWPWFQGNAHKVRLHPETRRLLIAVLGEVFPGESSWAAVALDGGDP